jgi:hypothetical protein
MNFQTIFHSAPIRINTASGSERDHIIAPL